MVSTVVPSFCSIKPIDREICDCMWSLWMVIVLVFDVTWDVCFGYSQCVCMWASCCCKAQALMMALPQGGGGGAELHHLAVGVEDLTGICWLPGPREAFSPKFIPQQLVGPCCREG